MFTAHINHWFQTKPENKKTEHLQSSGPDLPERQKELHMHLQYHATTKSILPKTSFIHH